MKNLVAVEADKASNGSIVFWRLGGVVNLDKLTAAWKAAGLSEDLLPSRQEPLTILKRTMSVIEEDKNLLVKPVERDTTAMQGFAVLHKTKASNGKAAFATEWEALIDATTDTLVFVKTAGGTFDDDLSEMLTARYEQEKRVLPHQVISNWLVALIRHCRAVGLRETGGIYFVPKTFMPQWREYIAVLVSVSNAQGSEIPSLDCEQAAEAVLDALVNESASMIEKIDGEMGEVGVRALQSRERLLNDYTSKLSAYADIIGGKLANVTAGVDALKARLSNAILANLDI